MRPKFIFLVLCAISFCGCAPEESVQEKFDDLKTIDYSEFRDMSIVNRKGIYLVTYHDAMHRVKMSLFANKISSVELASEENKKVLWTKEDTTHVEGALKSFDEIGILALSVDKSGNVHLSLPWYDRCTYHFLKLLPNNTLEGVKKQYYQRYEGNWYLDKKCSER
ncbi:hypothetical protein SAMN05216327_12057 [Dyadobacter sp. SG02]|uniref:hypothetical protein n=1 Tax=Dyadobacter sp. SG02 TaxID=1855291 RepID=UPI0008C1DD56|nr:hypothetical protein [Dyadobacter sp. SG02]SEJ79458.1 hypothetical protein SAMN05216327_12057 [Dyadobacter sp. SG02]